MSQPSTEAPVPLLHEIGGLHLEDHRHLIQMVLLWDIIHQLMAERGQTDFFVGGDLNVYHSLLRSGDDSSACFLRGPDIFFVEHEPRRDRPWVDWPGIGANPDLIIELVPPWNLKEERAVKKEIYASVGRTPECFLYDFDTLTLEGFRLDGTAYRPIEPDAKGRLHSEVLGVEIGVQHEVRLLAEADWLRLFYPDGRLVPSRAEAAEAELARLRALLEERSPQS